MPRLVISISAAALLFVGSCWISRSVFAAPKGIVGTWEMVSGEVNGQPEGGKGIKMISAHHFLFVQYDPKTMKTLNAGSGTYTLKGDSYVEHVDFFDTGGPQGFVGTDQKFTVKVDNDSLSQEGVMTGNYRIKETYKRLD